MGNIGTFGGTTYFSSNSHAIMINGTMVTPSTNTGSRVDNVMDLGASNYRFKNLYLSGGVDFGGAVNSGGVVSSSNRLDDYEEGTWTPMFSDAASGGNTDEPTGGKRGTYTKIGRQVTVTLGVTNIRTVGMTSTNDFFIQGLPFAPISQSSPNQIYTGTVRPAAISFNGSLTAYLIDNTTYFRLAEAASAAGTDLVRVTEIADNSADLDVTITYFTNA